MGFSSNPVFPCCPLAPWNILLLLMHIATAFQEECEATCKTSYSCRVQKEFFLKACETSISWKREKEISVRKPFVGKFKMHGLIYFQQIYSYVSQLFIAK